jgi:hypothetical protein
MPKNKFYIFVFFSILINQSCSPVGFYEQKGHHGSNYLTLTKEQEFFFKYNEWLGGDSLGGTWINKKDTIYLKFNEADVFINDNSLSKIRELNKPEKDSVFFEIYFENQRVASFTRIGINEDQENLFTDSLGKIVIPKTNIHDLHFSSLQSLSYFEYKVTDPEANHFVVLLDYEDVFKYSLAGYEPTTIYLKKGGKLIPLGAEKKSGFQRKRKKH